MDTLVPWCSVKPSHSIPTAQPSFFFLGSNKDQVIQVILQSEEKFYKCIFTSIHILYEYLLALSIFRIKSES